MINYGRHYIDDEDLKAVESVLRGEYLTTGPAVERFERAFADFTGSRYAVSVNSGTAALHISCMAAGLKADDELLTTPITFCSTANAALFCNAKPAFSDITKDLTGLMDPQKISKATTDKTKVILPVHYAGFPCDMKEIRDVADNLMAGQMTIIEDGCHALGASFSDANIGDCRYSDMTVFSFHPVKHITTGEGGMICTNSKELHEKLKLLRSHGIEKDRKRFLNDEQGLWYHEMQTLGYNYRLSDLQCSLGLSQLKKAGHFIRRRREIASMYEEAFMGNGFFNTIKDSNTTEYKTRSSYHLYPILLNDRFKSRRRQIFEAMRNNSLGVQVHYIPVYLHPYYQKLGFRRGLCPFAEDFYEREISIPIYPGMSDEEVSLVISTIKNIFRKL